MVDKAMEKSIDDLETMPEFKCGLWYSPYIKIYSIGGPNRIAEISNYPRAYKDTTPHVYTEDVPFVVQEGDLNHHYNEEAAKQRGSQRRGDVKDREFVYFDTEGKIFKPGEQATHLKGDPLPGAFPLWLESADLPSAPASDELYTFPCDGLPYPVSITGIYVKRDGEWTELPANIAKSVRDQIAQLTEDRDAGVFRGKFSFPKATQEPPKILVRICYERVFR